MKINFEFVFQIEEEERSRIESIKKSERDKIDEEMRQFQETQKSQRRLAIEQHVKTEIVELCW